MTENSQEQASSAILIPEEDGKQLEKQEVKRQAAALLLTTAPVETLHHEIILISALGPHFFELNMGIHQDLKTDLHADRLRTTLMKFNLYMDPAADQLHIALGDACVFYAHTQEEMIPPQDGYGQPTKETVAMLLDPKFQEDAVKRARGVAEQVANVAKMVRKVLPLLPQIKTELEEYVADYLARVSMRERRNKSWIRSFFDNIFGDPIAPTPWKLKEVSALPQHLSEGSDLLNLLPAFLDNMELHFRRLSEIQSEQVFDLGYTTEDLTRLYQDRLTCINLFHEMGHEWTQVISAFLSPTKKTLP